MALTTDRHGARAVCDHDSCSLDCPIVRCPWCWPVGIRVGCWHACWHVLQPFVKNVRSGLHNILRFRRWMNKEQCLHFTEISIPSLCFWTLMFALLSLLPAGFMVTKCCRRENSNLHSDSCFMSQRSEDHVTSVPRTTLMAFDADKETCKQQITMFPFLFFKDIAVHNRWALTIQYYFLKYPDDI